MLSITRQAEWETRGTFLVDNKELIMQTSKSYNSVFAFQGPVVQN